MSSIRSRLFEARARVTHERLADEALYHAVASSTWALLTARMPKAEG